MESKNENSSSRKRKTDQEKYDDLTKKLEKIQAQQKRVGERLKARERKERTKRLINAGASVEAVMKEVTGKDEYPAEGENLEKILDMLRSGNVLTDDQKRHIHAGEEIESFIQDMKKSDRILLTDENLDIIEKCIRDEALNRHYIEIGKIVEEKVHIQDLDIWSWYISKYADAISKYLSGEYKLR